MATLISNCRSVILDLFLPFHQAVSNIVCSRRDDRERRAQLVRDRSNELHLQSSQLNRRLHPASLNGPDGNDRKNQGNAEDADQPEQGASGASRDVRKPLRSLVVVSSLDVLKVFPYSIE